MVPSALAFALLVEHLDPGSVGARRGAPTLGRRNSRTADSASKEPESDSGRSNDGGLEERDAEPSDIARDSSKARNVGSIQGYIPSFHRYWLGEVKMAMSSSVFSRLLWH